MLDMVGSPDSVLHARRILAARKWPDGGEGSLQLHIRLRQLCVLCLKESLVVGYTCGHEGTWVGFQFQGLGLPSDEVANHLLANNVSIV